MENLIQLLQTLQCICTSQLCLLCCTAGSFAAACVCTDFSKGLLLRVRLCCCTTGICEQRLRECALLVIVHALSVLQHACCAAVAMPAAVCVPPLVTSMHAALCLLHVSAVSRTSTLGRTAVAGTAVDGGRTVACVHPSWQ